MGRGARDRGLGARDAWSRFATQFRCHPLPIPPPPERERGPLYGRPTGTVRLSRRWIALGLAITPYAVLLAQPGAQKVSYGRDVAPILKTHCYSCHSGAGAAAGLDLTASKGLLKGGNSGLAIVAGKPDSSLLMQRILGKGGKPQMPMGLPPLSADEMQTIRDWIAQGAHADSTVYRHWAYVAPVRPKVPALKSSWVRNPIDAFVLAKMKEAGLHPSPEASKETLIRRVSLDLTGLPPTLAEIDAFLADKRPDAYERLVDRLMASPHYGERMAREWLDLSRYADTDGFEKDLNRVAWKYRDWVIDAYNQNMSYRDFVIDQIAGDMLPNATLDDKIATGFERNTMMNLEGGVDQAEAHFEVIRDRVDTTATVFLGSTLQCAKCHDHKYDPFTQRDYYKMAAFFSNTMMHPYGDAGVGEQKWFEGSIPAPSPSQAAELARLQAEIKVLEGEVDKVDPAVYAQWQKDAAEPPTFVTPKPSSVASANGATLTVQEDGAILASGKSPDTDTYTITLPASSSAVYGFRIEALPDESLPSKGPGRAGNGNFVLNGVSAGYREPPRPIRTEPGPSDTSTVRPVFAVADYSQPDYDPSKLTLPKTDNGWAVNFQQGRPHELRIGLPGAVPAGVPVTLTLTQTSQYPKHVLGHFRISEITSAGAGGAVPDAIAQVLKKTGRTPAEEQLVRNTFLATRADLWPVRKALASKRDALAALQSQIPTALTLEEKPDKELPFCYVRNRGQFLSPTDKVIAGTPAILPPLPPGRPDRLALAKWLVSPTNPLTARVEVNRMWERFFGRGIVETSEDFGTRGSRPTHPELLDWLAVEFMHNGWNMKAINRLIVTSSTYRQSSAATPALEEKDPFNLLLARGPRFRMEAEMIHDAALADGGLLSLKVGGPSVMPYQPNGIWDSPYSGEQWMPSKGEDAYRRGIYTFLKRTAPYPAYLALDATSRESCTVRRIITNTPLQALELLNDKLMMQAAHGLALQMQQAAGTDAQRVALGFRICTARYPKPAEEARLQSLLAKLETRYQQDPKAVAAFGRTYRDAAFTMVGNVLLNLDETITKG